LAAALCLPGLAFAQSVSLQGSLGANKALLVIDGQPQTLAVGATARGVTLRRLGDGEAEVEVAGQVRSLRLGAAPARLGSGAAAPGSGSSIVLPVGTGGHFHTSGSINGKTVQFLVDTGATTIALGRADAERIGLDWKRGRPGQSQTANGMVQVHGVNLASVRIGDVEIANVAAVVVPMDMPMVLLGNSFLDRFNLRRDNDVMRLEKKP
jgi:aspartyl protease family protein